MPLLNRRGTRRCPLYNNQADAEGIRKPLPNGGIGVPPSISYYFWNLVSINYPEAP